MTSRRTFLKQTGAAMMAASLPLMPGWARASLSLGSIQVDTISDGHLTLPGDFIFGPMPKDELAPILKRHNVSDTTLNPECNITLVRSGDNVVLFDVGSGANFMPSAGKALESLEALDLTADDVTHVVFTHAHPDHLWGLLDDFEDPVFANATHMIGKAEWDYWIDPKTVDTIGESRTTFAVGAKRRLEAIEDAVTTFKDGEEILPGIAAHSSFGHTPGHMAFEIRDGSNSVMIVGDAIGNHHVGFERPQWVSASDQDPETAAKTRARLLDHITTDKMALIGFHLPGGGIGRSERIDNGYKFIAEK